jgi:hypothetical protein
LFDSFKHRKDDLMGLIGDTYDSYKNPEKSTVVESTPIDQEKILSVSIKPGVNVENVTPSVKNFINELGTKARQLGAAQPRITSGWRSVSSQASLMGRNWKANGGPNGGRQYLEKLYGREYGGQMAEVFERYGLGKEALLFAEDVIRARSVGSYHITGKALDISNTSGIKEVLDAILAEDKFDLKIIDETDGPGPHYHISIMSQKSKLANIKNRKERIRKLGDY